MNALLHDFSFRVPNKGKEDVVHAIYNIYRKIQCGNSLLLSNWIENMNLTYSSFIEKSLNLKCIFSSLPC